MSDLVDLSIAEARRLLLRRDVSSVELTTATIEQIERTEASVHAYATLMLEQALDCAERADDEIGRGVGRGALHGIPVAVKDLISTRGVATEAGSRVLEGRTPASDAGVVMQLREGGAVILGKTVTSEFAFGPTLVPTRNAWDQKRTPSGSSAGSAVAVAARSAFGALGTDTAGSIRAPAGVNGVIGLKPTFGLVSKRGVIPMSASLDHVGPITRTVADCALMMSAIAGFDPSDPHSLRVEPPDFDLPDNLRLDGVRLGTELTHLPDPLLDPAAPVAAEKAAAALGELGATICGSGDPGARACRRGPARTIMIVDTSAYHLAWLKRCPGEVRARHASLHRSWRPRSWN